MSSAAWLGRKAAEDATLKENNLLGMWSFCEFAVSVFSFVSHSFDSQPSRGPWLPE